MESRKLVLMNLSAGQQWRRRHREQTLDTAGGWGRWAGMGRGRRRRHTWLSNTYVWRKPTQYCKAVILQLKINTLKKKNLERGLVK